MGPNSKTSDVLQPQRRNDECSSLSSFAAAEAALMCFMPSTRPAGHRLGDQRSCCRCDSNNELKQKRRKLSGEIPKYISLFPISLSVSLTAGLQDFLFISVLVQVSEARHRLPSVRYSQRRKHTSFAFPVF